MKAEQLRAVCAWCSTLGGIVLFFALTMALGGGAGNPKTASSVFATLRASGLLRDVAAPVAFVGIALVVVGLVAGVIAGRQREP